MQNDGDVLLAATELYVGRSRHTIEDKKIFLELAQNLLPASSLENRRRISNFLSAHPETPDDLRVQLATDQDDLTAYPALRYSPRLSVDLLIETVRAGSDTLRKAIANRPSPHDSILTALCECGNANVIRILLDRSDVILRERHQNILSQRSDIVSALGEELAGQDALNPDGLIGQFVHLPAPLKAKAIASAEMTNLIKQAQAPGAEINSRLVSARFKLQDALVRAALDKDRTGFAAKLSQGLGLPIPLCDLLLHEDQGDALVIALKALDMTTADTTKVLIRFQGEALPLLAVRNLLRLHRTLSVGASEVFISQWILHLNMSADADANTTRHLAHQYQGIPRESFHTADLPAKSTSDVIQRFGKTT